MNTLFDIFVKEYYQPSIKDESPDNNMLLYAIGAHCLISDVNM